MRNGFFQEQHKAKKHGLMHPTYSITITGTFPQHTAKRLLVCLMLKQTDLCQGALGGSSPIENSSLIHQRLSHNGKTDLRQQSWHGDVRWCWDLTCQMLFCMLCSCFPTWKLSLQSWEQKHCQWEQSDKHSFRHKNRMFSLCNCISPSHVSFSSALLLRF